MERLSWNEQLFQNLGKDKKNLNSNNNSPKEESLNKNNEPTTPISETSMKVPEILKDIIAQYHIRSSLEHMVATLIYSNYQMVGVWEEVIAGVFKDMKENEPITPIEHFIKFCTFLENASLKRQNQMLRAIEVLRMLKSPPLDVKVIR